MSKSSFVFVILRGTVQFTNCTIVRDRLQLRITVYFKVIGKFFFKAITKVLDGISGITKNIVFFPFEGM